MVGFEIKHPCTSPVDLMISSDTKFPNRCHVLDKRLKVQERPLIVVEYLSDDEIQ